jgi:hypothetical protein
MIPDKVIQKPKNKKHRKIDIQKQLNKQIEREHTTKIKMKVVECNKMHLLHSHGFNLILIYWLLRFKRLPRWYDKYRSLCCVYWTE